MREFYVYGFRSRDEYTKKSARSYDDERRRIESWLGGYMGFRQTPEGKNVFLSIDSRVSRHNPLYQAWKAKSFTDGDITLHFLLFDLLHDPETALTLNKLTDGIDRRLSGFESPRIYDASSVRKKLKEYAEQGLIRAEKAGKTVRYRRAEETELPGADALDFFSEVAPCGVIGSFLLDKTGAHESRFAFKHHYITGALDSEILCGLFEAMHRKRSVLIGTASRRKESAAAQEVVPLRVFSSAQNGRQYLMAFNPRYGRIGAFRLDSILSVRETDVCPEFDTYRAALERMRRRLWGVSTGDGAERPEHVEFTVRYGDGEEHIPRRLEREKRCGRVERIDAHTSRFSADVCDAGEMVPWIRTFLCRIVSIHFSDRELEARFKSDLGAMYALYGLDGGEEA